MNHKQYTLAFYCERFGIEEGTHRYRQRGERIRQAKREPHWAKFIRVSGITDIIGSEDLSEESKKKIEDFFTNRNWKKYRKMSIVLAHWIQLNIDDWEERYRRLTDKNVSSTSKESYLLRFGDIKGTEIYNQIVAKKKTNLPNNREYYKNKGLTEEQITDTISALQKKRNQKAQIAQKLDSSWKSKHPNFVDYWIAKGHTSQQADDIVSILQKRDLHYFTTKYGTEEGTRRFEQSKAKRRQTWTVKDKYDHALRTLPQSFNPASEEIKAINEFILANNIDKKHCMYGSPRDQFWQNIPTLGFRRYDLAVFDDESRKNLKMILEYHGPGHINFSDYREDLKDEIITIKDRKLYHLGTYGSSYANDVAKRNHILETYPHVVYLVMWRHDWKTKKVLIDDLRK
jgi:hypothetical protein